MKLLQLRVAPLQPAVPLRTSKVAPLMRGRRGDLSSSSTRRETISNTSNRMPQVEQAVSTSSSDASKRRPSPRNNSLSRSTSRARTISCSRRYSTLSRPRSAAPTSRRSKGSTPSCKRRSDPGLRSVQSKESTILPFAKSRH
jgi:hypothetical protein